MNRRRPPHPSHPRHSADPAHRDPDAAPITVPIAVSDAGTTRDTVHPAGNGMHDPDDEPVPHVTHDPDTGLPWPDPSIAEPAFLTLAQFLFDTVSEATDGCFVEPDGICPHGHPSWLRRLGVI